jgi:regulator of protease activity HflC (stomatin/prohibitin superfamily)
MLKYTLGVILVIALLIGVVAVIDSAVTIDTGEVGLVTQFGALTGRQLDPGLSWTTPFIQGVIKVPTVLKTYETSDYPDTSKADYTDNSVSAQTIDGQQIMVKFTVVFRVAPENVKYVVTTVSGVTRKVLDIVNMNIIKPNARNLSRVSAQNYEAEDLFSGSGILLYQAEVREKLATVLLSHGIVLDDFLIRKIDFDVDYVQTIENQQIAQEQIKTAKFDAQAAEFERDRLIRLAEAEKQQTILNAEADAQRVKLNADAQAYAINSQGEALRVNPEILSWEFIKTLATINWAVLPADTIQPFFDIEMLIP